MIKSIKFILVSTAGLFGAALASAQPAYETYGSIVGFSAGNTPHTSVAIAQNAGQTLTLGLTAQPRYFNPGVSDNGAGTFFATTGQNNGLGSSAYQGSTWNFDFYIQNTSTQIYTYDIKYGL